MMNSNNLNPGSEKNTLDQAHEAKTKVNAELISQWYQSYYLWTSTYMLNSLLNQQKKTAPFHHSPAQFTQNNGSQPRININFRILNDRPDHLILYKIPTLTKRLIAEIIDVLYIQISKIILAVLIVNYTNLM